MNIFTYGSLMFPEVWEKVTGLNAPGMAATLDGHVACRIRGQSYPVLRKEQGGLVSGVLYKTVPPEAVARLDVFEGSFYERVPVTVGTKEGRPQPAWVYRAARPDHPDILPERWEAGRFARDGLPSFLRDDPGFTGPGRDEIAP